MFSEFNSSSYFINLFALFIVLLPLYRIVKAPLGRRLLLIFSGAYLIYFIAPRLLIFYAFFWLFIFFLHRAMYLYTEKKGELWCLAAVVVTALMPMVVWKLWHNDFSIMFNLLSNQALGILSGNLQEIDFSRSIIIPVGLSFATFRAVDLIVKTYTGRLGKLSLDRVLFYGFFPPVQAIGPIIEYEEIEQHCNGTENQTANDLYQGAVRIVYGLLKVFVLSAILLDSSSIFGGYTEQGVFTVWLYLFLYMWFFYLNFSGYSDLAIGTSRLLGIQLKENFSFPYFKRNISEFWNCWHMSLSRFAQRNAFIPLGGYRKETRNLATLTTMMVIALWHNISIGMIVFGLYHGVGLILHREFSRQYPAQDKSTLAWLSPLSILATNIYVALSFPLLVMSFDQAIPFYLALVGWQP